ncbi:hypothetical protein [Thalassotalea hakodatensis]|uniref:hypothetical protein n=1 Tax=Thalassotalea hakodatensis TaxID=3030492 RepID=UPI0025737711|nr:hypothetical protein [Thalassotalea hakodatensis]
MNNDQQTAITDIFSSIRCNDVPMKKPIIDCDFEELKTRLNVFTKDVSGNKTSVTVKLGGRVALNIQGKKSFLMEAGAASGKDILDMVLNMEENDLKQVLFEAKAHYKKVIAKTRKTRTDISAKQHKRKIETAQMKTESANLQAKLELDKLKLEEEIQGAA